MAEPGAAAERKLRVFLSYSRKDQAFADDLVRTLDTFGFDAYIDREDIAPGEAWEERLGRLIEATDTVVFAVSPDAVASEQCDWEVERAEALGKRLIPVVCREVPESAVPARLTRLNYIFFAGRDATFGKGLSALIRALNTDIDWIREHTRLAELAARWDSRGRSETLLLRGADIDDARAWLARRPKEAPEPTEAHRLFIAESEAAETTRNSEEKKRLEAVAVEQRARARVQRRFAWALGAATMLVLGFLGFALHQSYRTQVREAAVLTSLAQRAIHEGYYDRAMRIALQGLPPKGAIPWISHWSQALEAKLAGGAMQSGLKTECRYQVHIASAEFSPDGSKVVTALDDGTARIWDATTGAKITAVDGHKEPDGHKKYLRAASFSSDGSRVTTTSADGIKREWDAATGAEIAILGRQAGPSRGTALSPDGRWTAVTRYGSTTMEVQDAATGKPIAHLRGHTDSVRSVAFSPDNRRVVTASDDKTARIWNIGTQEEILVLKGHDAAVWHATFSSDGRLVVTGSWDKTARVWNAETGAPITVLRGHEQLVRSVAFSPDGRWVLTVSDDKTVRLWDLAAVKPIAVSKGQRVYPQQSARSYWRLSKWNLRSWRVWDRMTNATVAVLDGHEHPINGASFNLDRSQVVTVSDDGTAQVWDAATGTRIASLIGHRGSIKRASFSFDGGRVVTAGEDRTARVWDAATGTQLTLLDGHDDSVYHAAFNLDGSRVLTTSKDRTARIWDAETGGIITVLKGHEYQVWSGAFSPDSRRVVTSSFDKTVRLWDVATGAQIATLKSDEHAVYGVAFSLGGDRVELGSDDDFKWSWDVSWATKVRRTELRDRVCAEKLNGAQAFTLKESEDPILVGLAGMSPCDRRGPLALKYWTDLAADLWRAVAGSSEARATP
jgi:FOG: WD40 repeat